LRLLDAIKDMKRIPGTTGQDIYNRVKSQYFNGYSLPELEKIVSLAKSYPPPVRKGGGGEMGGDEKNTSAKENSGKDHSSHDTVQLGL